MAPSIRRPAFTKLEEWLENLKMHLDIGLPLVSEVGQLHKAFWENNSTTRSENGLHVHPEQPEWGWREQEEEVLACKGTGKR